MIPNKPPNGFIFTKPKLLNSSSNNIVGDKNLLKSTTKKIPAMAVPCQCFPLGVISSAPEPVEWLSQTSQTAMDPSQAPACKWVKLH